MHVLAVTLLLMGADAPWERVSERDGLVVEVQSVPNSGYENIRVTTTTRATPQVFIKALWGKATDSSASPEVKRREVLIDEEKVRRYWDLVHAPPASDRDYVMHEEWAENDQGAITMAFGTVSDAKKPVSKDLVRFGKVAGRFTAAPRPEGGSALTYEIFTDLGGAIPAWLTLGAQRESARKFVIEIRRRAEEAMKK